MARKVRIDEMNRTELKLRKSEYGKRLVGGNQRSSEDSPEIALREEEEDVSYCSHTRLLFIVEILYKLQKTPSTLKNETISP